MGSSDQQVRRQRFDEEPSVVYHALRAPRRRYVIEYLSEMDQRETSTRTLARSIASQEENLENCEATGAAYRNVYNALSQTHLPTLSEAGIINYDPNRQVITVGEFFVPTLMVMRLTTPILRVMDQLKRSPSDSAV